MKKVLAICLVLVMAASAAALAFAQGGFVSSPSGNAAPVIIEVTYEDGSCEPRIVVTSYSERDTLNEEKENDMNEAYNDISESEDLTVMCPGLASVAAAKGVKPSDLAVSDLFDVSAYHTIPHDYCGTITIVLSAETLRNFVALLHRHSDGEWAVVPNVIVNAEESTITFSAKDLSPFAVVVDTSAETLPNTGANIYVPAILMAVSAISLIGILVSLKKKKQEV